MVCLMQEFDTTHGPGWQSIVGTDFGSFVTHCYGCFIHLHVGSLAILLFRGSAAPDMTNHQPKQFPVPARIYSAIPNTRHQHSPPLPLFSDHGSRRRSSTIHADAVFLSSTSLLDLKITEV
ncbi:hypothetical protein LWI28_007226 [Acer negundo]|uniref:Dynein light chain n=1 Tax=Acer negundo TaxID=4023 RepID=A0AAD5J3G7_ACENE|nr:hypothetical protein LWI28_007226 [Acer negundo]